MCAPLAASRAAPIAAASSPSAAGAIASASIIGRGSRRAISLRTGSIRRSAADAMMPPRTSISGSIERARDWPPAMPRYFAVSRITEIDDAVAVARRVEHVLGA